MVAALVLFGCTSCTFFPVLLYISHYIGIAPKKCRKYRNCFKICTGACFAVLYFCEKKCRITVKSTGSAGWVIISLGKLALLI